MAHKNCVIHSINLTGDHVFVDVFRRPDGTYGFDEFRRDPEETSGWYSIGHYSNQVFADADMALCAAKETVGWLAAPTAI